MHPADLDDALCTSAIIVTGGGGETRLPFAVDSAMLEAARGKLWAVRRACCEASLSLLWFCFADCICVACLAAGPGEQWH